MTREEIIRITERITSGLATEEEIVRYNKAFNSFQPAEDVWEENTMGNQAVVMEQIHEGIVRKTKVVPFRKFRMAKVLVAASITALIAVGTIYIWRGNQASHPVSVLKKQDVLPPSGNKAVLTLANGKQIALGNSMNDTLSTQGGVTILGAGEQVVYSGTDEQVSINMITVPKGSTPVSLTLADGTHVSVDAGSSLKFPTAFPGKVREVTLTGQAYFEVDHAVNKPFFVHNTQDQTKVEVLGTGFNVKAFEGVQVTLIDGALNVRNGAGVKLLRPNEQALVAGDGTIDVNRTANLEQVLAWRRGLFLFDGSDIRTIMQELERHYDIKVVYKDNHINERFVLRMQRGVPISEVLNALSMTKLVQFKIEGRTIFVSN